MARRRRSTPAATALVALSDRVGFMDAARVLSFLAEWATTMRRNEWEPFDIEHFAEDWGMSRASAYRRQALFRKAFPGELLPNERILAARQAWLAQADADATEPKPEQLAAAVMVLPAA